MNADLLAKAEVFRDLLHCSLNGRFAHRGRRFADAVFGEVMLSSICRKQKAWMSMTGPVVSQKSNGRRRQWHVPVLGSLATMDMNPASLGVDVTDLQMQRFIESESQRIDGPEIDEHSLRGR